MKQKSFYALIGLILASKIMAQDANQARWMSYINNLTSIHVFDDYNKHKRAQTVMQDNEFDREAGCTVSNVYENPLLLNGKILDYSTFSLMSEGLLTLVKGRPETTEAKAIPFYVSIRRDGKIIEHNKMTFKGKKLFKVPLSDIFPFCKDGDVLIINPVNPEDWRAKRILKLIGDGC